MKLKTMLAVLLLAAGASLGTTAPALSQSEVKVGLIAPLSGPWARQGDLMLKGANLAIDRINANGGIKAL
jgi:branched-chain amino acid transport system substrate-binding protein